jgi:hypothetical protein
VKKAARRFRVAATGLEKEIPGKKTDQNPAIGKVCSNLGWLGSRKYGSGKETRRPLPNGYRIGMSGRFACRIFLVTRPPALELDYSNLDYGDGGGGKVIGGGYTQPGFWSSLAVAGSFMLTGPMFDGLFL